METAQEAEKESDRGVEASVHLLIYFFTLTSSSKRQSRCRQGGVGSNRNHESTSRTSRGEGGGVVGGWRVVCTQNNKAKQKSVKTKTL